MSLIDGLYVERLGTGPPMLCMHGGMGFDQGTLRPWLEPLNGACELIFYDHRGNGRSERPADWSAVDHASWVRDAEVLRETLGLGAMTLFGHSWGGFLAQQYALQFPDAVERLILCSTAPALDYGATIVANAEARGTEQQVRMLLDVLSAPQADDVAFRNVMRAIGSLYFHDPGTSTAAQLFEQIHYSAPAFNRALFDCAPRFNTLARLHELAMPVLLLGGADDWIMPPDHGVRRIHAEVPHAAIRIFEQSGHFPFVEEQAVFVATVKAWLARTA